ISVGGPGAGLGGGVPGAYHAIRAAEAHAGVETGITAEQLVAVSPAAGSDGAGARHIGRGSRRAAPTIVVNPPVVGSQNRLEPTCPRTPPPPSPNSPPSRSHREAGWHRGVEEAYRGLLGGAVEGGNQAEVGR